MRFQVGSLFVFMSVNDGCLLLSNPVDVSTIKKSDNFKLKSHINIDHIKVLSEE